MKKTGAHFIVTGRVQGVYFRGNTKEVAEELGLTGWTQNLPNGDVEVLVCGDEAQIKALHEWLHQGPRMANVTNVVYEIAVYEDFDGFEIRR